MCKSLYQKKQISIRTQRLGSTVVKNPPANAGDTGSILGQEDSLEKEMATHSGVFAWEIPQTEETGGLQSMGLQKSQTHLSTCAQAHTLGNTLGTSLAVHWLRLHASTAGGPACHAAQPEKKEIPSTKPSYSVPLIDIKG